MFPSSLNLQNWFLLCLCWSSISSHPYWFPSHNPRQKENWVNVFMERGTYRRHCYCWSLYIPEESSLICLYFYLIISNLMALGQWYSGRLCHIKWFRKKEGGQSWLRTGINSKYKTRTDTLLKCPVRMEGWKHLNMNYCQQRELVPPAPGKCGLGELLCFGKNAMDGYTNL